MDKSYHKKHHLILIPGCKNECFYINSHPYEGEEKVLEGGIRIQKGDPIIEIHMNNQKSDELKDIKIDDIESTFGENRQFELTIILGNSLKDKLDMSDSMIAGEMKKEGRLQFID